MARRSLGAGGYEEITAAVSDQLAPGLALEDLTGSRIDALKLVYSLTFLHAAAECCASKNLAHASVNHRCGRCWRKPPIKGSSAR